MVLEDVFKKVKAASKELALISDDRKNDILLAVADAIIKEKGELLEENKKDLKIEIEVRNLDELREALATGGVDRIMFDNFTPELTREAVKIVDGKVETESSGGITIDTLRAYGECGVDYISVGALTHSVKSLDMSFKAF